MKLPALDSSPIHQGDLPGRIVTRNDLGPRTTPAERKRQQRARDAQSALLFERADWSLFLSPATLPQKAGCQPSDLRALVLREIVDNALDAGARATLHEEGGGRYVITRRWPRPRPSGCAAAVRGQPATGIEQAPAHAAARHARQRA